MNGFKVADDDDEREDEDEEEDADPTATALAKLPTTGGTGSPNCPMLCS